MTPPAIIRTFTKSNVDISVPITCGGTLTATSDVQSFGSPGWPGGYAPNMRCEWTIIAPAGERISMKFQTYDGLASQIESTDQDGSCKLDSVVFYDGKGLFTPSKSDSENFLSSLSQLRAYSH